MIAGNKSISNRKIYDDDILLEFNQYISVEDTLTSVQSLSLYIVDKEIHTTVHGYT